MRSILLDIAGASPDQIAEAELIKLAQDTNALMGPFAKDRDTLEGFLEFAALHDTLQAGE